MNNFSIAKKNLKFLLVMLFAAAMPVSAQTQPGTGDELGRIFYLGVFVFFFFVFVILLTLIAYHNRRDEEVPTLVTVWRKFSWLMNKSAPVEKEQSLMLDHDYDGIKELDNVLPPWWKYLFYVTIVWGIVYMVNYHVINIWPLSDAEYKEEVQIAEAKRAELIGSGAFITAETVKASTDPAVLNAGGETFKKLCAACHGQKAEGLVGPNLTDDYWIHGGGIKNVFTTIVNGVPEKGMLSWKSQLNPKQIMEVASYVLSLKGSNPPNAKPPMGALWVEAAKADTAKADTLKSPETGK